MPKTHFRTCPLCEAMCGLKINHTKDEIISIKGDAADPFSNGHICPKGYALQDIHFDKDRLTHPVMREGANWRIISWETAFSTVARKLVAIQKEHGDNSVGIYWGNPTVHNYGGVLKSSALKKALNTRNNYSATSVDQLPHQFVNFFIYGHNLLFPIPDIDKTDYFLMLGANPAASNGSLMSAGDFSRRMKKLRQRGGTIILIDPRRNETARLVDRHYFIHPATDAFFLIGLLKLIIEKEKINLAQAEKYVKGLEFFHAILDDFGFEELAKITGIPFEEMEQIADDFASAPAAACYGRMGVSTQEFGALTQWLIHVLNIISGNFDQPGGVMFNQPAVEVVRKNTAGHYNRYQSRVRKRAEFCGEFPSATMAEEMLTEGPGQIKAFITNAGNPVLSTPNGSQLEKALTQLEFMVAIDFYINETTANANIILPPHGPLEHDHYDLVFNLFAVRNRAHYSKPLFKPAKNTRSDFQIFSDLATRINKLKGRKSGIFKKTMRVVFPFLESPQFMLDVALRTGPYGAGFNPFAGGLSLRKLKKHPHGIDLGPLQPCMPNRLFTEDKKINLAPEILRNDLPRLKKRIEKSVTKDELVLIGRRDLRSNNSWMHNSLRLVKGKNRCTLLMHPEDAAKRQIEDGQIVRVISRIGEINVAVQISDEMMVGVVCLPHGWGHDRAGIELAVAKQHSGVSVNNLTDDHYLDELSGNAAVNGVPVKVLI
ncbi:MAG: molybdopterin oxidoreductase family protein [Calditrichaeota bacterium]|nr:MAG: molybdopterin oxidoreductase family protein [Calditrichota bacterium]